MLNKDVNFFKNQNGTSRSEKYNYHNEKFT